MLVLSRKPGEVLQIGTEITVRILDCSGSRVRVGIQAPGHVRVLRAELEEATESARATVCRRPAVLRK